jgi:hypothetical protein
MLRPGETVQLHQSPHHLNQTRNNKENTGQTVYQFTFIREKYPQIEIKHRQKYQQQTFVCQSARVADSYHDGSDAKQQQQQIGEFETHPFPAFYYKRRNCNYTKQGHRTVKPKVFSRHYTVNKISVNNKYSTKNRYYSD